MAPLKTVIALGMFDGVHIGHREILNKAKALAVANGAKLLATTFSDEFATKRFKSEGLLFDEAERVSILKACGADEVIVFPADDEFLDTDAEVFLARLTNRYCPCAVVAGEDFTFGKRGRGNSDTLKAYYRGKKTEVVIVPLKTERGAKISTSEIKTALSEGNPERAGNLLGRAYSVTGTVVSGRRDGSKNGVPTANIEKPKFAVRIKDGVYETETEVDGILYPSITNIGAHPTFGDDGENVETNLIGFDGNLYGKKIKINFIKRMRDIKRFPSEEALFKQIRSDIEEVKHDQIRRRG